MPSEKLEKSSNFVLKKLNIMEQNNSQAELVRESEESSENERSWRDVKWNEWVSVGVLCYVNLINYMDRFTVAGFDNGDREVAETSDFQFFSDLLSASLGSIDWASSQSIPWARAEEVLFLNKGGNKTSGVKPKENGVLEEIRTDLNVNNEKGGLLQTAFIIFYMAFGPLFGYLGDRYSRRWLMAFGVTLWSLTTLCGSFMTNYWWFLLFRAMVGIGEASYSTIAPTILSDLFVGNIRSKMLALFYFAIPVGSGLGYIIGAETAKLLGSWHWALRVTPALGLLAVFFIIVFLREPERGASEGSAHMEATSWTEDLKDIVKCKSFVLSTAGFTCVAFVAGALAWWGPTFIEKGVALQGHDDEVSSIAFRFGIVAMISGLVGVPAGSVLAQRLRPRIRRIDAYICGVGLIVSCPFVFLAIFLARYSTILCFTMVFFGEVFLNLTWSIVADILLYVIMPIRRSTAEGFQLLVSHALGDAGSPYLIGVMSEAFLIMLNGKSHDTSTESTNSTITTTSFSTSNAKENEFKALQYALFTTCFVEVIGGLFFLLNALYIVEDKERVDRAIHGNSESLLINEDQQTS